MAHRVVRPRIHVARQLRAHVLPREEIAVAPRVHNIGIVGARGDPAGLATTRLLPIADIYGTATLAAWPAECGVVLLRAADVIREMIGRDDVIHLRRRVVLLRPRLATVDRDLAAAVIRFDHATRILWVDPEILRIAMTHAADGTEGLSAVSGFLEGHVVHVH